MEITCKTPKVLWDRISKFKGDIKITKVDYENNKLMAVTIKEVEK